jgi:hypothetical protein
VQAKALQKLFVVLDVNVCMPEGCCPEGSTDLVCRTVVEDAVAAFLVSHACVCSSQSYVCVLGCSALNVVSPFTPRMRSFAKHIVRGTMLDDAPWTWGGKWTTGMPQFFADVQEDYPGSDVYGNVWDQLDTTPAVWHITDVSFCVFKHVSEQLFYGACFCRLNDVAFSGASHGRRFVSPPHVHTRSNEPGFLCGAM